MGFFTNQSLRTLSYFVNVNTSDLFAQHNTWVLCLKLQINLAVYVCRKQTMGFGFESSQ